ncbi:MAG: hypothetical protein ACRBF0_10425 [Calditrichia bacterium]
MDSRSYLPGEVICPECGIEVSLDSMQRRKRVFSCPGCLEFISADKYKIHTRLGYTIEPNKKKGSSPASAT